MTNNKLTDEQQEFWLDPDRLQDIVEGAPLVEGEAADMAARLLAVAVEPVGAPDAWLWKKKTGYITAGINRPMYEPQYSGAIPLYACPPVQDDNSAEFAVMVEDYETKLAELRAQLQERRKTELWCPDIDPITRYPLFMWIEHPALGYVPTYGGPYDSYTLAERDENGEFFRHRYDHDFGGWVEDEYVGLIVVEDWLPKNEEELDEYVRDNQPEKQ